MRILSIYLMLGAILIGAAAHLSTETRAQTVDVVDLRSERRAECLNWLDTGYPSGIEEVSCRSEFDLPSPFLLVCARGLRLGFKDALQREACTDFFAAQSDQMRSAYVRR